MNTIIFQRKIDSNAGWQLDLNEIVNQSIHVLLASLPLCVSV